MLDTMKRDILMAFALFVIVSIWAIAVNEIRTPVLNAMAEKGTVTKAWAWRHSGLKLVNGWPPQPVKKPSPSNGTTEEPSSMWPFTIYASEAKRLFDEGECVFLDARSAKEFEIERISGAVNWPSDSFDVYYRKLKDKYPLDQCLVAYCSGGACDESYHLATSLVLEGWKEVYLYMGGIEEWKAFGFPIETGAGDE